MTFDPFQTWLIIFALGIGTFLIRFSFIGLVGDKEFPEWVLRLLRYTPVAVMPGLVAPLVLWPSATGGEPDAARIIAAFAALFIGYFSKNLLWAVIGGISILYLAMFLIG